MGLEDFIEDALYQPNDYIGYHVGRELAKQHPGKAILEGQDGPFDLESYVDAGKCQLVPETFIFNQSRTEWRECSERLGEVYKNAWLNILWRGQLIDVLFLTYTEGCRRRRHHWIIAEDREIADEFSCDVRSLKRRVRAEVLVFEDGEAEENEDLCDSIKSATFENLILREPLKRQLQADFARFFASGDLYAQHGIPWKRGALFIGTPGNGKTLTAKALINQLKRPCLFIRSFKVSYGTELECIQRAFSQVREMAPCLVVMEDLDSMIDDQNRAFFLNELDGFTANTGVVVLATTNHPERLGPEILDRLSRFDRRYYFDLPTAAERESCVAAWNATLDPQLRIWESIVPVLVKQTAGFSFAYLKELLLAILIEWTTGERLSMEAVMLAELQRLRAQMTAARKANESSEKKKPSWTAAGRALLSIIGAR